MHWRRAHLLGSCAAACSAMYVWPAADACSSGLQVGWLGASLVMTPCASFSFRHGHRAYATRRVQPRCPVGVGHTTRGPARHSPRLGALIRFGVAPRSPTGLLQPAVGASGCRRRVTRHPAGHSCHCFRCAGGAPSSQATQQGALQRASVVAGSSRTSRSRRPGIQSQAWAGSPAIAVGFASVAQAGVGACRDCGGIGVVKERGSVAWRHVALALEVNLSAR